jgi:hypothetical protein
MFPRYESLNLKAVYTVSKHKSELPMVFLAKRSDSSSRVNTTPLTITVSFEANNSKGILSIGTKTLHTSNDENSFLPNQLNGWM